MPIADWATIWKYIETPVDMNNLSAVEQHNGMGDEEALRLMVEVAEGATVV